MIIRNFANVDTLCNVYNVLLNRLRNQRQSIKCVLPASHGFLSGKKILMRECFLRSFRNGGRSSKRAKRFFGVGKRERERGMAVFIARIILCRLNDSVSSCRRFPNSRPSFLRFHSPPTPILLCWPKRILIYRRHQRKFEKMIYFSS